MNGSADLTLREVAAAVAAERTRPFLVAELTDEGLARLLRAYKRDTEDGRATAGTARLMTHIRGQQMARLRLRMRYGARDDGTGSYDRWYRLDEAPSYVLAAAMDRARAVAGQSHVLRWPGERVA